MIPRRVPIKLTALTITVIYAGDRLGMMFENKVEE
jgi:hypothetical protein